jgi:hypothetical protein
LAAADTLTASITGSYFSWRDTTDNQPLAAGLDEKWNFLIYYKPTSFTTTDPAVISQERGSRSGGEVARGPSGGPGGNTVALGLFNEAEAAYPFDLSQTLGLDFTWTGRRRCATPFKIRQWRSFVEAPIVTFDADAGGLARRRPREERATGR